MDGQDRALSQTDALTKKELETLDNGTQVCLGPVELDRHLHVQNKRIIEARYAYKSKQRYPW